MSMVFFFSPNWIGVVARRGLIYSKGLLSRHGDVYNDAMHEHRRLAEKNLSPYFTPECQFTVHTKLYEAASWEKRWSNGTCAIYIEKLRC
jgi:hypothetical protein